jgi:hypothetical protein
MAADFYKLNIYGPGGFFKPHYDTPRSSDMFGSLVVCLPSPHSGGGLVLRHKSNRHVSHCFDWSTKPAVESVSAAGGDSSGSTIASSSSGSASSGSTQQQLGAMQWAAFYSDSEHEVLPVTDGYRITLTYNLRAVGYNSGGNSLAASLTPALSIAARHSVGENTAVIPLCDYSWLSAADVASSAGLVGHLKKLLADERWHPEGACIGHGSCIQQQQQQPVLQLV